MSERDLNGTYVRKTECGLMRENIETKLESIKKMNWFILGFQVITIGGAVVKWVIG